MSGARAVGMCVALSLVGCLDLSVERYCARFPELCTVQIRSFAPNFGPETGGTKVEVSGLGFDETPISVFVRDTEISDVESVDAHTLRLTMPPGRPGCASVRIVTAAAQVTRDCPYLYEALPAVTSSSPDFVSTNGDVVFLRGHGLRNATMHALSREVQRRNANEVDDLVELSVGAGSAGPFTVQLATVYSTVEITLEAAPPWTERGVIPAIAQPNVTALALDEVNAGGVYVLTEGGALYWLNAATGTWHSQPPPPADGRRQLVSLEDGSLLAVGTAVFRRESVAGPWNPLSEEAFSELHGYGDGAWAIRASSIRNLLTGEVLPCPAGYCASACRAGDLWVAAGGNERIALWKHEAGEWQRLSGSGDSVLCDRARAYTVESDLSSPGVFRLDLDGGSDVSPTRIADNPAGMVIAAGGLLRLDHGVLQISRDHGETWRPVTAAPMNPRLYALGRNDSLAVVGATGPPFVGSDENSLEVHADGLPTTPAEVLAADIDPSDFDHLFARTTTTLLRSTSGGADWEVLPFTGFARPSRVRFAPTRPMRIVVGTLAGVQRSDDGGARWERILSDPTLDVSVSATDADDFLAATSAGVKRTLDGGATWTLVVSSSEGTPCAQHLSASLPGLGIVCAGAQLLQIDGTVVRGPIAELELSDASLVPTDLLASPTNDALCVNGKLVSPDDGEHWVPMTPRGTVKSMAHGPTQPAVIEEEGRWLFWSPTTHVLSALLPPSPPSAVAAQTDRSAYAFLRSGQIVRTRVGGR